MLLYYITDRTQFAGDETLRQSHLLKKISEAALAGVDYIQLREKDLPARELESLARKAVDRVRASGRKTRLLINSRTDIALAVGADGVHLRSSDISPADARRVWGSAEAAPEPIIAVSCHTDADVVSARNAGADFVVFGPIFEKKGSNGETRGVEELVRISRHQIPVFALGGVTLENARSCLAAGASGIAAIRMFQGNEIATVVEDLTRS